MILTLDVGNSNVVVAVYDDLGQRSYDERFVTDKNEHGNYYRDYFLGLQSRMAVPIRKAILSCVVADLQQTILASFSAVFHFDMINLDAALTATLNVNFPNYQVVGADLVATAVGASTYYSLPMIIADVGSATKLSMVSVDRQFLGGVIAPGLGLSNQAMHQAIVQLPKVDLTLPDHVISLDTIPALQSGLLYGTIAMISGLADRMEQEYHQPCQRMLTGGYGPLLHEQLPDFIYDPFLVNVGLYAIVREIQ